MVDGVLSHVNLNLVDSTEKAGQLMSWLGKSRDALGVDTETSGFSFHQDKLRMVQFGDLNEGWAVPWERWGGLAVEVMQKYRGRIVLHNMPFDARFMIHHSGGDIVWPWHRADDTMTQSHLTDPELPHGLKSLAGLKVDPYAAVAQRLLDEAMHKNKWTWGTVPLDFPLYWVYGAMDPVLTCYLDQQMGPTARSTYRVPYELELGTLRSLTNMMLKGALIDKEYCYSTRAKLQQYATDARIWVKETYGIENIGSRPQMIRAIEELGTEITRRTDGGDKSVDKYQLQLIEYAGGTAGQLANVVLQIRKAEKMIGPYFDNFIADADSADRLHPTMWALGARTARMSITDPGLQTLPKKDGIVRKAFVPSLGNGLITCDYDQIEMRLMTHFSQDPGLAEAFRIADAGGGDFFLNIAAEIYGETMSKKDARRQLTKNTMYGKAYGAGVQKMAETAGVPFEIMEPVVAEVDRRYPGIRTFQKLVEQQGLQRLHSEGQPYIVTPTGRRMPADADKVYVLTNYLIQCHAAEVLKTAIVDLDAVGLGEYMILPVHDELIFDVPLDQIEEAKIVIGETMSNTRDYLVPITASAEILLGSWGQKYEEGAA